MGIALDSISQNSTDTICLPISQLKIAINRLEEGKVLAKENVLLNIKVDNLERRINLKDSIIGIYLNNESQYRNLINNYETNISNNAQIVTNLEKMVSLNKKIARRQKFQKWMVAILGVGLGILVSK
jgi:ABC-type antimicrobial peptide transport system permease subunit